MQLTGVHMVQNRLLRSALVLSFFVAATGCGKISAKLAEHTRLSRIGGDLLAGVVPADLLLSDQALVVLSVKIPERGTTEVFPVFGDISPPLGDGAGTHYIIIRNQTTYSLVIRLRYERESDKYQVLDYMIPKQLTYRLGRWSIER